MAIQEIVQSGRSFRLCIDNTPNNKKWLTIFFKGLAKDIEMNDGTTVQQKLGNFKGTTTNENQVAGYAADVTLVKSIKTSLTSLITSLTNLVNSINSRLGGLRFYEDSNGKWVVGADSVPKKLGSGVSAKITHTDLNSTFTTEDVSYDTNGQKYKVQRNYVFDIKSVSPDYATLTTDNFYFCTTKSKSNHYIAPGYNIPDPNDYIISKKYNPVTGHLIVENVAGGSYETNKSTGYVEARIAYEVIEFELLII